MQNWRLVHIKKRYEIGGLTTREAIGFLMSLPEKERDHWLAWRPGSAGWAKATECSELAIAPTDTAWWFTEEQVQQSPPPIPMAPPAPLGAASAEAVIEEFEAEEAQPSPQQSVAPVSPTAVESVAPRAFMPSASIPTQVTPEPVAPVSKIPPAYTPPVLEPPVESIETALPSNIRRMPQRDETRRTPRVSLRLKVVVTDGKKSFRAYSVNVSLGGLLLEKRIPWSMSGKSCQVYLSNETSSESISFVARILSNGSDPFRLAFEECDPKYLIILQSWMNSGGDGPKAAAS